MSHRPAIWPAPSKQTGPRKAGWERSSYTRRKELVLAVEDAKKPETRARRIQKAVAELAAIRPKK